MTDQEYWLQFELFMPEGYKLDSWRDRRFGVYEDSNKNYIELRWQHVELLENILTAALMNPKLEIKR